VVFLYANDVNKALLELREHGVAFADCAQPLLPEFRCWSTGIGQAEHGWARCIAAASRLERLDPTLGWGCRSQRGRRCLARRRSRKGTPMGGRGSSHSGGA
jgi:hypothetical protein